MKANKRVVGAGFLILAVAILVGCGKSSTTTTAAPASAPAAGTTSLINQLGGMSTVTQLASAFGVNIANNPVLSQALDAGAITQVQDGFVNEVAKASGIAPPKPGVDLLSTLSEEDIDSPEETSALTTAMSAAADQVKLGGPQKTAVMNLLTPITNKLLG